MKTPTNCAENIVRNIIEKIIPEMKEPNMWTERIYSAPQKIKKCE